MANKELPHAKKLRKILRYEPDTGKLFWLTRSPNLFEGRDYCSERLCASWNARFSGKEALTAIDNHGYMHGCVFSIKVKAHRAAWAVHHGYWPINCIDHLNGDRLDNRIVNLRDATHLENSLNSAMQANNTSGHNGVGWHKQRQKWRARIVLNGEEKHLGLFDSIDDAVAARQKAQIGLGFTERHGR